MIVSSAFERDTSYPKGNNNLSLNILVFWYFPPLLPGVIINFFVIIFSKGLIIREKIYSEFSSFRNEYQNLR